MKEYLTKEISEVLSGYEDIPSDFVIELQTPQHADHGDLATNCAMKLARHLRKAPRLIAEELTQKLIDKPLAPNRIESVEVAGPGFINFRFSDAYLYDELQGILDAGDTFGRTTLGEGKRAIVEFVSANPTGPLTVGHGRNAVLGDTIANMLEWVGYDVTREYYFNNAGRQMRVLGQSVQARYNALVNPNEGTRVLTDEDGTTLEVPTSFPDDGYRGDYIIDIARQLVDQHGDGLLDEEDETVFKDAAEKAIFKEIEKTLLRLKIKMDTFFNENSLYESNRVWEVVEEFRSKNLAYDAEGAVWFKTTDLGREQDKVLVKSSGEPTYRLPDMAYHADKFDRGFDKIVDIFGADHIATVNEVMDGVEVLGYNRNLVDVVIYQFVTLVRSGVQVKMSTRKATYVTLDELMDQVGDDVTRYFFLMRSPNTHLEFDLDLAKEAGSKNPVFYLQYGYVRIASILRKAEEVGFSFSDKTDLALLTHEVEIALIKHLLLFPQTVQKAAEANEPHKIAYYLTEVATLFMKFFAECRIIGEEQGIATARMRLASATQTVLKNGLTILGISTPDRM